MSAPQHLNRAVLRLLAGLCIALALLSPRWHADVSAQPAGVGYEPPSPCNCQCGGAACEGGGGSAISFSEGDLNDGYDVARVESAFGPTIDLSLRYSSTAADGSKMQLDTGIGFGWTHSYNLFLFRQAAQPDNVFRLDAMGRISVYRPEGGGAFRSNDGQFEVLTENADATFTIRDKSGAQSTFAIVPDTPAFSSPLHVAPVYRLIRLEDRTGNVTALSYVGGKLAQITDTFGRAVLLNYSAAGKLQQIIDPAGRLTTLEYNASSTELRAIHDPAAHMVTYSYNAQHQLTRKVDRDGRAFVYRYANGKPVAIEDGAAVSVFTLANPQNWAVDGTALATELSREYIPATTSQTDGRGNAWRHRYDKSGYVIAVEAPDGALTEYEYDPSTFRATAVIDGNGHATTHEYDSSGNLTRTTNALGHATTYAYEPVFNHVTTIVRPNGSANGAVTRYTYDAVGNRISEIDPLGAIVRWTYDTQGNVLTETDKRGAVTRYQYDTSGNRVSMIDALGWTTRYAYDAVGNLVRRIDANGRVTTYAYDELDRLVIETDPLGNTTRTAYDGEGNRIEVVDPNGHGTRFEYDERGRLTRSIDALGWPTTYSYDANNNRVAVMDARGSATQYAYDTRNRLVGITDALGQHSSRSHDAVGNLLTEVDANGHSTTYAYDELNRRVRRTDAIAAATIFTYDTSGSCAGCVGPTLGSSLVTRQTDANGKVTYQKYDALDRLVRVIRKEGDIDDVEDPSDAVAVFVYDANGNRRVAIEPNGNRMTYQYDALDRVVVETNAAGDVTRMAYDRIGNVASTTAPNTNVTSYVYDAAYRVVRVQDRLGLVSAATFDRQGNRLSTADGNANVTRFAYDALDRIVRQTDPKGNATTFEYDEVGNLTSVVDREGRRTSHDYDAIYRRVRTMDQGVPGRPALVAITQYEYDAVGNLLQVTDPNGRATRYAHDSVNRRIAETHPDASPNTRTFAYDLVGNLIGRTDQKAQTTRYAYNDLYFLMQRDYDNGPDDAFSYDLSGRMLSADRGGWRVTFAYDGANRIVQSVQGGRTISYAFSIPQRQRRVTHPGGRVINEQMDVRNRLTQVYEAVTSPIAVYRYDTGNRVLERRHNNGVSAFYSYDANDWITSIDHRRGTTSLVGFDYAHDKEGNTQFERKRHAPSDSQAYQYDGFHRLVAYRVGSLVGSTVPIPATQTAYDLDLLGNWNNTVTNGIAEPRTHNEVNEITSIAAAPLLHDDNGNLSDDRRLAFEYDAENRLVRVSRIAPPQVLGEYQYDALGRRISKLDASLGQETFYFYDGQRVVEEQTAGAVTRATYVYGNYIDDVLAMNRGGQTLYYLQNALWSVHALSNASGTLVEGYRYDAYGDNTVFTPGANGVVTFGGDDQIFVGAASSLGNPYTFTGRERDDETGLLFYRARHYDALKGRFAQRDPKGSWADFANRGNAYTYVGGNPASRLDPDGRATLDINVKGQVTRPAGAMLYPGSSGAMVSVELTQRSYELDFNVSDGCCSDANILQIARYRDAAYFGLTWSNFTSWEVDDGRITWGSDKSELPPYYNDVHVRFNRQGKVTVWFSDSPSSPFLRQYEFEVCALCVSGKNQGLVYGCARWLADTGQLSFFQQFASRGNGMRPTAEWMQLAARELSFSLYATAGDLEHAQKEEVRTKLLEQMSDAELEAELLKPIFGTFK